MELPEYAAGGRIAFQTDRDDNSEIYVMGCDGKNQVNLTNHSAEDKQPSWASGGRLAFSSNRNAAGGFDIYLLTLDPWEIARLTTGAADDESPALSPDGGKVAFVSYRDGDAEIYVLEISSNTLRNFTNNSANDLDPAWSSDGARLAFASDRDDDWDIYVSDSDSSNITNLTDSASDDSNGHNDRWPDLGYYDYGDGTGDELIAFASDRDGDWEIYTMYSDGSDQAQATANSDGTVDADPSWSGSGEQMVFHTNRDMDSNFDVWKAYYDGSGARNLTRDTAGNHSSPDWEPVEDADFCEGD